MSKSWDMIMSNMYKYEPSYVYDFLQADYQKNSCDLEAIACLTIGHNDCDGVKSSIRFSTDSEKKQENISTYILKFPCVYDAVRKLQVQTYPHEKVLKASLLVNDFVVQTIENPSKEFKFYHSLIPVFYPANAISVKIEVEKFQGMQCRLTPKIIAEMYTLNTISRKCIAELFK